MDWISTSISTSISTRNSWHSGTIWDACWCWCWPKMAKVSGQAPHVQTLGDVIDFFGRCHPHGAWTSASTEPLPRWLGPLQLSGEYERLRSMQTRQKKPALKSQFSYNSTRTSVVSDWVVIQKESDLDWSWLIDTVDIVDIDFRQKMSPESHELWNLETNSLRILQQWNIKPQAGLQRHPDKASVAACVARVAGVW